MTAIVVIAIALLVGAGLVASQLFRLKDWLAKSPPLPPPLSDDEEDE
jgi:hypothetical protein